MRTNQTRVVLGRALRGGAVLALAAAAACKRGAPEPSPAGANPAVTVGPENVAVADSNRIQLGPLISGSLQAEEVATVRAEAGGSVLDVNAREGQAVRRGQLLARIEQTGLGATQASAQAAVASARIALQQAQRDAGRSRTLAQAGAVSQQQQEQSQNAVSAAQSQLSAAQSQLANANRQLGNTRVAAPISGVVSNRAVNEGDVVQPGAALFTVVDPSSMQLQASVPSGQLSEVRVGAPVEFTVNGYPDRTFTGKVQRISPTADPATGQVPIWVAIPNPGGALVAGLFAQGQVASQSRQALVVPLAAVDTASLSSAGGAATVMRLQGGKARQVQVELGVRDPDEGQVAVRSGLSLGDTVLVGTARDVTPGTPVRILGPASAATARAQR